MDIQIKSSRAILATDSAVKKLKELKSEESSADSFLRMGVKPGGCSGFSYEMFFDTDKFDGDVIEEYDGVNIVVDGQSLEHVKGATLDYKEGLMNQDSPLTIQMSLELVAAATVLVKLISNRMYSLNPIFSLVS